MLLLYTGKKIALKKAGKQERNLLFLLSSLISLLQVPAL
jgi:hypothetical protein